MSTPKILPCLLGAALALPAAAGRSTEAVALYTAMHVETLVSQYQMLCAARQPDTATAWRNATKRWREANAGTLREIRRVAAEVGQATRAGAFDPRSQVPVAEREWRVSRAAVTEMMIATQPAIELARASDAQAAALCTQWRGAIAAGGDLDTGLAEALATTRQALQAEQAAAR